MLNCENIFLSLSLLIFHFLFSTVNSLTNNWKEIEKASHNLLYLTKSKMMNQSYPESDNYGEFYGNSSDKNHFKFLQEDDSSVLIGARNVIYNLSLPGLEEFEEQVLDISFL